MMGPPNLDRGQEGTFEEIIVFHFFSHVYLILKCHCD